jgi:L-threonylcarbamoyladenylate synthase
MITNHINRAVVLLNYNNLVAIPTETVYGLAANTYYYNAAQKIFELKKSHLYKPLIVYIKSATVLNEVAQHIPEIALKLAKQFWPGPLTLLRAVQK